MKKITLEYFAKFRDQAGKGSEVMETDLLTAAELYQYVSAQYQFDLPLDDVKLAINEDFASWDVSLQAGDTVVFIPPVSGG